MNAKEELLKVLKDSIIKCASIRREHTFFEEKSEVKILNLDYSVKDYENFLESMDFEYDNGYGIQELHGVVWLEDGTWLTRGEYDGSEWWVHNVIPEIPKEYLTNNTQLK